MFDATTSSNTNSETAPSSPSSQKAWDSILSKQRQLGLLSHTTDCHNRSRLLAAAAPHSGEWLNALPSASLGLKLTNEQVRIAVALRLGLHIAEPHKCDGCGAEVDHYATHGLSCRKSRGRYSRHQSVNDLIKRALVSANIPSTLEPQGLSR